MPAYVETWDDLNKKYSDTFIRYAGQISYCCNIVEKGGALVIHIKTLGPRGGLHEDICVYDALKLEELHVNARMFNKTEGHKLQEPHENTAVGTLLWKSPRRQWKRSLCRGTVHLVSPVAELYSRFGKSFRWNRELSFQSVIDLFTEIYPTVHEGFKLLERLICVAVGPDYCLVRSTISDKKALVASKFGFIGEFHPEEGFTVQHPPAAQELKDFLQRTQQTYKVSVDAA